MAGNIPGTKYSTSDFLSKFGNLAQSSQYRAHWAFPNGFNSRIRSQFDRVILDEGSVLCKATSLPGSSIATHDVANDYYGVTQKSAYKRQFDNTIDLTFFIDSNYQMLYLFEAWMEYIMPLQGDNIKSGTVYYKAHYPNHYRSSLFIHKFNKDHDGVSGFRENARPAKYHYNRPGEITYEFINAFPQNISSTQVSYDASANLEFTVTFAYDRYITSRSTSISKGPGSIPSSRAVQATKDQAKDNPSDPGTRWVGANSVWTDRNDNVIAPFAGDGWDPIGPKWGEKLVNNPVFDFSSSTEATKGGNNNDSTQQLKDARDGVGSNTTVASTKSKNT